MSSSNVDATIRAYAAAWGSRDREAWLATFALDATQEDPVGEAVRRGHREIGQFWDQAMDRYDSIEIVPREVYVIGREAAMVWTINGATADGAVTFDGVDVFSLDDTGRIASVRAYWSREALHRQFKLLKAPRPDR